MRERDFLMDEVREWHTPVRKANFPGSLVVAAVACLVWVAAVAAIAQEWTFRFSPPENTTFVETVKETSVQDLGALGKRTQVTEAKTRVTMKKTPEGYSVLTTPLSVRVTRDGQEVKDPMLTAMLKWTITYQLGPDGKLQRIQGYDAVVEGLKQSMPPETAQALSSVLSEEAMASSDKDDWNKRTGNFIGRKVNLGDVWTETESESLPTGGNAVFFTATKFAEQAQCGGKECVRVQFSSHTDPNALKEFAGKFAGELAKLARTAVAGAPGVEVSGSGERMVDPSTMLIYSETTTQTIKLPIDAPGWGKISASLQEKKEYTYDYK